MRKFITYYLFAAGLLCGITAARAQSDIITTVAGTGTTGFSGDGGPATAATMNQPARIVIDAAGNKYFTDAANSRVRKINTAGIISTYAGNGVSGYGGDGGPATAAQLNTPIGLALDAAGNLFVADQGNYRIRKITTAGVISTVAGNGSPGYYGEGGPATVAAIGQVGAVAFDAAGNMYIVGMNNRLLRVNTAGIINSIAGNGYGGFSGDGGPATASQLNQPWDLMVDLSNNILVCEMANNRIRKIDPSGIITTFAGNGTTTYTGDGGPATAAGINAVQGITTDSWGNIIFCNWTNAVVRKIDPAGTVSTIAGTGTPGFSGDGGPAILAQLATCTGLAYDASGTLYIIDAGNNRIRKFGTATAYASDSLSLNFTKSCSGMSFVVSTRSYAPGMSIVSNYGDGTSATTTVTPAYIGTMGTATFAHAYGANGTYAQKHVLMHGTTAVDSITLSYEYKLCNTISLNYYLDENSDCIYNSLTDHSVFLPITVEIDSNGIPMDTVVTPGGLYYKAYGSPGDIYTVRVIGTPPGLVIACPSTGVVYDTVQPLLDSSIASYNIGFNCSATTGFDLRVHVSSHSGRHAFISSMLVDNVYCTPHAATVNAQFSNKYSYYGSNITPSSVVGNSVTWNFTGLSSGLSGPTFISLHGEKPSLPYLLMGDTSNSRYSINPETGDLDTTSNNESHEDTVTSSFDPNYISVLPNGCISSSATNLEYAIGFENTGNDTAYDIYILDTLAATLDASSVKVVSASAFMRLSKIKFGTRTILKFDFPHIMLPDSSHHDVCNGLVIFTVKTKPGLSDGTQIHNQAGIYFDTNPVVMTNASTNTVNCPPDKTATPVVTSAHKVFVFPNPASDVLNVRADNVAYSTFAISNQLGQILTTGDLIAGTTSIGISALAPGMYYITLKGDDGIKVQKFVKQ